MPDDFAADFVRRERISDTLMALEQRIRERLLPIDDTECWDLVLNRPPLTGAENSHRPADPLPLRYETQHQVSLLRVVVPDAENRACLHCELFGRSHCGGGLLFLYYALRDAGVAKPLEWLAVEITPSLYLPDWELMAENSRRIMQKVRDYFELHLDRVSAEAGDQFQ